MGNVKLFMVAAILSLGVGLAHGQDIPRNPGKYLPTKSQATPAHSPTVKATQDKKVEPAQVTPAPHSGPKATQGIEVDRVAVLVEEAAALRNMLTALKTDHEKLRAEYEQTKQFVITSPPKGYSSGFITKLNWDRLSNGVGIKVYFPLSENRPK